MTGDIFNRTNVSLSGYLLVPPIRACGPLPVREGGLNTFYTGRLRPEVQPLTFYVSFFTEKVLFSIASDLLPNGTLFKPTLELCFLDYVTATRYVYQRFGPF